MVKELVGSATRGSHSEGNLTLRARKRTSEEAGTTRIDQNTWRPPLVDSDSAALCQTLYDGVAQEDRESMYNTLLEAAKNVGVMEVGERTILFWKLSENKRAVESGRRAR